MRWRTKDPEIEGNDRHVIRFHNNEINRVRRQVLMNAGLADPTTWKPLEFQNVHPRVRGWIRRAQLENWRWQSFYNEFFWTRRMEKAYQQTFANQQFMDETEQLWLNYLGIEGFYPKF
jgi:hypothetical protein